MAGFYADIHKKLKLINDFYSHFTKNPVRIRSNIQTWQPHPIYPSHPINANPENPSLCHHPTCPIQWSTLSITNQTQTYLTMQYRQPHHTQQGGHWSWKFDFSSRSGKVREFCTLVREILNTKEVREKLGSFIILAQKYLGCSRYFVHFKWMKMIFFLTRFARSILLKM